jgi:hypothetical protein
MSRALRERFSYTGERTYLSRALDKARDAQAVCEAESTACPTSLLAYGEALIYTAQVEGADYPGREPAEKACREALSLCDTGHPLRPIILQRLAIIMFRHMEANGDPSYLHKAIDFQRSALDELPSAGNLDRHFHLGFYGAFLRARYAVLGDEKDIEAAIEPLRSSMALCPPLHIDRELTLQRLAQGLCHLYERSGATEDLEEALGVARQALAVPRPGGGGRLYTLHTAAYAFGIHLEASGSADSRTDIEELVRLHRETLELSPMGHHMHWISCNNLADTLRTRFLWNAQLEDLEEAVQLHRYAIDCMPAKSPDGPRLKCNIAEDLYTRFKELGHVDDLDEAIHLNRSAANITPTASYYYRDIILQMVAQLCLRFETLRSEEDLEEAAALSGALLNPLPDNPKFRTQAAQSLSNVLLLRGRQRGSLQDIDHALSILSLHEPNSSDSSLAPQHLRILGALNFEKFKLTKNVELVNRARQTWCDLLDRVAVGRRDRFQCLLDLAELHLEYKDADHGISSTLNYLTQAIGDDHRDVRSRIRGAVRLLDSVEGHLSNVACLQHSVQGQLLDIYASVVSLLPRIAYFGLDLPSRLQSLSVGQSIALRGASCALNLSQPERALEILEQGRAVFWTHSLRLRSQFDDIPDALRHRVHELARQLELSTDVSQDSQDLRLLEKAAAHRRRQTQEFDALITEVRSLPGFHRFMLPDDYSALSTVSAKGPVVVLVSTPSRCSAVIVRANRMPSLIELPSLNEDWLVDSGKTWRSAVGDARSALRNRLKITKSNTHAKDKVNTSNGEINHILERLWEFVVRPIIEALGCEVRSCGLGLMHPFNGLLSRLGVGIDPACGGAPRVSLRIYLCTLQAQVINAVRTMSFRPTYQHLEPFSMQDELMCPWQSRTRRSC